MRCLFLCLLLSCTSSAFANQAERLAEAAFPETLDQQGTTLQRTGQGITNYLWVDVYAAAFYAEAKIGAQRAYTEQAAQQLTLYYFRDVGRDDVIKAANTVLKKQQSPATLARLQKELDDLHAHYRDINKGDRYSLAWQPGKGLDMQRNGKVIFHSDDAELARVYLGIWLAPDGLDKALRRELLGK